MLRGRSKKSEVCYGKLDELFGKEQKDLMTVSQHSMMALRTVCKDDGRMWMLMMWVLCAMCFRFLLLLLVVVY